MIFRFCLRGRRREGNGVRKILGTEGVGLAGDAFDVKIVRGISVAELLWEGSFYKSMNKKLQVPTWIYRKLERWHYLSFLKARETMEMLKSIKAQSLEPDRIEMLMTLINEDQGFYLHRAVQQTKCDLSEHTSNQFSFQSAGISISRTVTRKQFEMSWIQDELITISACLDRLLSRVGTDVRDVDRIPNRWIVFRSCGPAYTFEQRCLGANKLAGGSEFTSVAKGLAFRSLEAGRQIASWHESPCTGQRRICQRNSRIRHPAIRN